MWDRPALSKKYDIINGLLKFTINPEGATEKLNSDTFKSKEAKTQNELLQTMARTDKYVQDITLKIEQKMKVIKKVYVIEMRMGTVPF